MLWIALAAIIVCLIVIGTELFVLFLLSKSQEENTKRLGEANETVYEYIDAILHAPNTTSMENDIEVLRRYVDGDRMRMDALSELLLPLLSADHQDGAVREPAEKICEAVRPQLFYSGLLENGTAFEKAYACRKLAEYLDTDSVSRMKKYIRSRNEDLAYNAAMALAVLGNEDGVAEAILYCQDNFAYSHRVILEMIRQYTGDVPALALRVLNEADDYITATLVKALVGYKIRDFEPLYRELLLNSNVNIRISAVKALGEFADPENEHALITAANDKIWQVRAAAVKAIGKLNTENGRRALAEAVKDSEWWVRYNAARALVVSDEGLQWVETVLKGYDRYAADAVKYALYKEYGV